ncbi:Crp/Fnr family transcriptional regulator [Oceanithermus sp.]|uniref:Crp/Fnr family transcriptional regulator n=1 Tax=Oceanithermus sp. TaxID=2268145 RepID=UPI0025808909|nr:Crp/Fnr family transcriptional regulator [Oceanithermus sp.]
MNLPELSVARHLAERYSAHSFVIAAPEDKVLGHASLPPDWFGVITNGIAVRMVVDPESYEFKNVGPHLPGDLLFPQTITRALETYELSTGAARPEAPGSHSDAGDVDGFHEQTIQTLTPVKVLAFDASSLLSLLLRDPKASLAFANLLATALAQRQRRGVYETGSAPQRVAYLLHRLYEAEGGIPYSQESMAQALGISREVVTETLRILKEAGIVSTTKQGRRSPIKIEDPERLKRVSLHNGINALKGQIESAQQPLLPTLMEP